MEEQQWIALNKNTTKIILNWISNNPKFIKSHKYTLIPDEFFFQSVLKYLENDYNIKIKKCLTYANWLKKNVSLPVVFTSEDIDELKKIDKNMLFARKFDLEKDKEILQKIDIELR